MMTRTALATAALAALLLAPVAMATEEKAPPRAQTAFAGASPSESVKLDHADYSAFLGKYVTEAEEGALNTFDYGGVTPEDRAALDGYVARMTAMDPKTLTRDQKFAYFANLYNAITLQVMLDAYPTDSIKDVELRDTGEKIEDEGLIAGLTAIFTDDGPWDAKVTRIDGVPLSLNDIEHNILRKMDDPAMVHYAVNCASIGCPDLRMKAWKAETLAADLDAAAREYVNHPRGIRETEDGDVVASSIYEWFQADFGEDDGAVLAHMLDYAEGATFQIVSRAEGIDSYVYDWSINAPGATGAQ